MGIAAKPSPWLDKCSTTELHPHPQPEGKLFTSLILGVHGWGYQIDKTPNQPAYKALDVVLGLKYKAYSN